MVNLWMLNLNSGKKAQSGLLILVGLVVTFILVWMVNMYTSATQQKRIIETVKLSKISKYLDFYKGLSRESLLLAVHTGTKQTAAAGGSQRDGVCRKNCPAGIHSGIPRLLRWFASDENVGAFF